MPFCPKCKAKYREGFKICSDCRLELVDKLPQGEECHGELPECTDGHWQYLMNTMSSTEADGAAALLKESSIPLLKRHSTGGDHLDLCLGMSNTGVNIYVPREYYGEALELIKSRISRDIPSECPIHKARIALMDFSDDEYERRCRLYVRIIIIVFVGPGIVMGLIGLLDIIKSLITG